MFVDRYPWCKKVLERRHHTLVAGCSGSGKSVAIHDILYTAMLKDCSEYAFVLIDTKKVELVDFKDAPHTAEYCDDPDLVYPLLKGVLRLMENRFERMQAKGLKMTDEPIVYVVIDEFYDVMTLCDKKCKPILNRISSAGRAAGVLLLVGTQRTTRDTLSGMIATNFPVKIGLRTVTAQDSRNILQVKGCEKLPRFGKGIMQIDGVNEEISIRYTEDSEIKERVDYWRGYYKTEKTT